MFRLLEITYIEACSTCDAAHKAGRKKSVELWMIISSLLKMTWHDSFFLDISFTMNIETKQNKQQLKAIAVKTWQSITKKETQRLVRSMILRLQAFIENEHFILNYWICPITFEPLEWMNRVKKCFSSSHFYSWF